MTTTPLAIAWVDLRQTTRPRTTLSERVSATLQLYPCDILFVHRDSEGQPAELRYREIASAVPQEQRRVAIVPVRMQEAWLLHDEPALRLFCAKIFGPELIEDWTPLRQLPAFRQLEADTREALIGLDVGLT